MKEFNLREYNRMCAEFLGFANTTPTDKDFNIHEHPTGVLGKTMIETNFTDVFTKDWNWIHEVVEKIQKLEIVHGYERNYDNVYKKWVCTLSPAFKTHDFGYIVGKSDTSEKEAVVQAIWQFLCWYKECRA